MIVGLTGKKQAGKSAAAKLLAVYSPLPVVEVSFAAKLKELAAASLGISVDDLERWKNDPLAIVAAGLEVELGGFIAAKTQTVRQYVQSFGQAHRDLIGEDFWVDMALPRFKVGGYKDALYVVTDVRYENEATRVRALDGDVVRVTGPSYVEHVDDPHPSEKPLERWLVDYELLNVTRHDGFASLDFQVRRLLRWLGLDAQVRR